MADNDTHEVPMVVLMLDRVRRVSGREARQVVAEELGEEVAATVTVISENSVGMSYIEWRVGSTPYHLGTSSEPYLPVLGVGKVDDGGRLVEPMRWTMREEVPPDGDELSEAWMAHTAWLYVDALLFHSRPEDADRHVRNVLRIGSRFIDERCTLVWLWGNEPKRVALPTPQAVAALRSGEWPT